MDARLKHSGMTDTFAGGPCEKNFNGLPDRRAAESGKEAYQPSIRLNSRAFERSAVERPFPAVCRDYMRLHIFALALICQLRTNL